MPSSSHSCRQARALWVVGLLLGAAAGGAAAGDASAAAGPGGGAFDAYVGLLAAAHAPAVAAFAALLAHTPLLPRPLVHNGIVYTGAAVRLRRVMSQLLSGQPVSIGALGGAACWGASVARGQDDWLSRTLAFMRAAFPGAAISGRNGCVPATPTEFAGSCIERLVSTDVDLLFVEFAGADGYLDTSVNNAHVRAFERLLRKLLRLPKAPAVVLVNSLAHDASAAGAGAAGGSGAAASTATRRRPFHHSAEDQYGVLAQYYQLPWLSLRDAVWHGLAGGWPGLGVEELFLQAGRHRRHLSARGHGCMADIVIGLLQQTYLDLMLQPLSAADVEEDRVLPAPMFPGNAEGHRSSCSVGLDAKAPVGADHADWYFVNEGSVTKPQWGWVSHVPNATLVLELDTRAVGAVPVRQLSLPQKLLTLQQHGMFAAAAQLQLQASSAGSYSSGGAGGPAAAAASPSAGGSVQPGGLEAAMLEAQRQAAAVGQQMAAGVFGSAAERLVGGGGLGGLQLPAGALQGQGTTTTTTGVQVVPNPPAAAGAPGKAGRHLLAATAAPAGVLDALQQQQRRHASSNASSSTVVGSGPARALQGSSDAAPLAVPPPLDAVHLKPARSSGGGGGMSNLVNADMLVLVGFHLSHSRMMGRARLSCLSGCACEEAEVDLWLPPAQQQQSRSGRAAMAQLQVTQSAECRVGVQVLQASSTGHHKVKVTGVLVSRAVVYAGDADRGRSALLAAMEEQAGGGS